MVAAAAAASFFISLFSCSIYYVVCFPCSKQSTAKIIERKGVLFPIRADNLNEQMTEPHGTHTTTQFVDKKKERTPEALKEEALNFEKRASPMQTK